MAIPGRPFSNSIGYYSLRAAPISALNFLDQPAFAPGVILHLVAFDLADLGILAFGVEVIKA